MNFPLTTLDLDIARINYLGDRMLSRYCENKHLYDTVRTARWVKDVVRLKQQRFQANLPAKSTKKK